MQCNAKSKRSGERCKRHAVPGLNVCNIHGGKSPPPGPTHPNWVTGRRTKYVPDGLRERYAQALRDPELLSMRAELGLIDVRLDDALQTIANAGGREVLSGFREVVNSTALAFRRKDWGSVMQGLLDLQAQVRDGAMERAAWQEVTQLIEHRQRVVESERKRLLEIRQYVTITQAQAYAAALLASVTQHVHNPQALRAIARDFQQLAEKQQMAPGGEGVGATAAVEQPALEARAG